MRHSWMRSKLENAIDAFFELFSDAVRSSADSVFPGVVGRGSVTGPGTVKDSNLGSGSIEIGEGSIAISCKVARGCRLVIGKNAIVHDVVLDKVGSGCSRDMVVRVNDGAMLCGVRVTVFGGYNSREVVTEAVATLGEGSRVMDSRLSLDGTGERVSLDIGAGSRLCHSQVTIGSSRFSSCDYVVDIGRGALLYSTFLSAGRTRSSHIHIGDGFTVLDSSDVSDEVKFMGAAEVLHDRHSLRELRMDISACKAIIGNDMLVSGNGNIIRLDALRVVVGDRVTITGENDSIGLKYKSIAMGDGSNVTQIGNVGGCSVQLSEPGSLVIPRRTKTTLSMGCNSMLVVGTNGSFQTVSGTLTGGNVYLEAGKRFIV